MEVIHDPPPHRADPVSVCQRDPGEQLEVEERPVVRPLLHLAWAAGVEARALDQELDELLQRLCQQELALGEQVLGVALGHRGSGLRD